MEQALPLATVQATPIASGLPLRVGIQKEVGEMLRQRFHPLERSTF